MKFICDQCGHCNNDKRSLANHVKRTHGENQHPRLTCLKTFPTMEMLAAHQRSHVDMFKCDECDKAFNLKKNLNRHAKTHSKNEEFKCEKCLKSFNREDNLARH